MKTFVLSDNTKNSYGFCLDMTKLQLDRFKKNPVMLYNHGELVGKWDNIRVEDGKLLAEPSFMDDEAEGQALKIAKRVEKGFLKGASLGLNILSVTNTPGEIPLVEAEVYECSIVDVPSNANAVILYNKEGVKLEGEALKLALYPSEPNKKNDIEMKLTPENIKGLNLDSEANDTVLNTAIATIIAENVELKANQVAVLKEQIKSLVELGLKEGRFTADKKEQFEKLAHQDFDLAKSTIESLPVKETLAGKEYLSNKGAAGDNPEWTFEDWRKKDTAGLLSIKKNDPARYAEILKK